MARTSDVPLDRPGQIIEDRIKELGLSHSEVANLAGLKTAGTVSHIIRGSRRSRLSVERVLKSIGLTYENVFFHGKNQQRELAPAAIGGRRVPLISYVQAGSWTPIVDNFNPGDADEWLLTDLQASPCTFALEIIGDSMLPEFKPGDRVIIDPDIPPGPGDYVVAKNGEDEATFKRYKSRGADTEGRPVFDLVPLNDDFKTIKSSDGPVIIIGTMIEHRKYRRKR